jgi:hypothetical protein
MSVRPPNLKPSQLILFLPFTKKKFLGGIWNPHSASYFYHLQKRKSSVKPSSSYGRLDLHVASPNFPYDMGGDMFNVLCFASHFSQSVVILVLSQDGCTAVIVSTSSMYVMLMHPATPHCAVCYRIMPCVLLTIYVASIPLHV